MFGIARETALRRANLLLLSVFLPIGVCEAANEGKGEVFGTACEKVLAVAGGFLLSLILSLGVASAGEVDVGCDCEPDVTVQCNTSTPTYKYCSCTQSTGLGAWDTNTYNRSCDRGQAYITPCPNAAVNQVSNLPKNVTCTVLAETPFNEVVSNECTNWNFGTRHFTIEVFCCDNC